MLYVDKDDTSQSYIEQLFSYTLLYADADALGNPLLYSDNL